MTKHQNRRLEGAKPRLRRTQIEVAAYENLATLCWNRRDRFIAAKEVFQIYERNWRFVDTRRMKRAERELIERLTARYGNGVLNV